VLFGHKKISKIFSPGPFLSRWFGENARMKMNQNVTKQQWMRGDRGLMPDEKGQGEEIARKTERPGTGRRCRGSASERNALSTADGIRVRSAEYWLKLGEPDEALRELEALPKDAWGHPAAVKARVAAVRALERVVGQRRDFEDQDCERQLLRPVME
jgi:hypothetical protein